MAATYLASSAIVKLAVQENESLALRRYLDREEHITPAGTVQPCTWIALRRQC